MDSACVKQLMYCALDQNTVHKLLHGLTASAYSAIYQNFWYMALYADVITGQTRHE